MVMLTFRSVEERTVNYERRELGGFLCESKILKKPIKILKTTFSNVLPNAFAL